MLLLLIGFLLAGGCTASSNDGAQQSLTIYTARDKDEVAHVVSLFTAKYPKYKAGVNIITLGAQAALDRKYGWQKRLLDLGSRLTGRIHRRAWIAIEST